MWFYFQVEENPKDIMTFVFITGHVNITVLKEINSDIANR